MNVERPTAAAELGLAALAAVGDQVFALTPAGECVGAAGALGVATAAERVVGRSLADLLPTEAAAELGRALVAVHGDGVPRTVEFWRPASGGRRYHEARIAPAGDGTLVAVIRDVHQRRDSEHRLRESEGRFRLMADCAPVMLWMSGLDAECNFFNEGWLRFTGRPLEAELGTRWAEGIHPADFQRCMDVYLSCFVERRGFRMEYRLRRADGAYRWILDHGEPRFGPDGGFEGFVGSCIDITDLKVANDRVLSLNAELGERVRERDVLLQEVHHRVKNNLQLICSLLNLQARTLGGDALAMIEEALTRVRAIALVHDKLYDSTSLVDVDGAGYVRDVVRLVLQAIARRPGIDVTIDVDDARLSIDRAVPCGLMIGELVTNALKHAFPGDRTGTVGVELRRIDADHVRLVVRDDGVGLPAALDLARPRSLGLDLIAALGKQLEARVEIERSPGTSFAFTFRLRECP